ncbi:MAG: nucleoside monophosphate kinase [Bacilli bacterium]|nr:nucleoside monophosphate kinase [Bacilli bacterium]
MNITFIAPPAAGKGALSNMIYEKYGFPHISIGGLLRNVEDPEIKKELEEGAFVDNKIVAKLLYDRIKKDDCKEGFILDGFPRNESQVDIYNDLCHKNDLKNIIIVVDIPKEVGELRITGRRVCPNCSSVYNVNIDDSKPKVKNICDDCGHELEKRSDDNLETYDHRFEVYENETAPILNHFSSSSNLYHVDGTKSVGEVFSSIDEIIKENL